jgi:hypothetical protein
MLEKILIVVACLGVPILWGIVVNWLFRRRKKSAQKSAQKDEDDSPVIEYYI